MSKADELAKAMAAKQSQDIAREEEVKSYIDLWITDVQQLFLGVESLIAPLTKTGLRVTRQVTHKNESVGLSGKQVSYTIERLLLQLNDKTITLDPIGRFIFGSRGRVDIKADRQEIVLARSSFEDTLDQWLISSKPERGTGKHTYAPFDDDYILNLIQKTFGL